MARKDAVIFLAGLKEEHLNKPVDPAATRLASAFDEEASAKTLFSVGEGTEEDYGPAREPYRTRVSTIFRQESGGTPEPLLDLYGLDYNESLVGSLPRKRPITQLLGTFWILLSNAHKLLLSIRRPSKKSAEKWQVRIGVLAYLVLFVYFLLILGAAAGTAAYMAEGQPAEGTAQVQPEGGQEDAEARQLAQGLSDRLTGYLAKYGLFMQFIVVWVTALGLFVRFDIKSWIEHSGRSITAASQYLSLDRRRAPLAQQFAALLNHIGEKGDDYRQIHVVAYSFGSIIALDAIFPYNKPAGVFRSIGGLVTVGCPFDFIRTYWPDYFKQRTQLEDSVPRFWANIYSAADVLSSDFQDHPGEWSLRKRGSAIVPIDSGIGLGGDKIKGPDRNIRYGRPTPIGQFSYFDQLSFIGFRMHNLYWEGGSTGCFLQIVRELYAGDPALD